MSENTEKCDENCDETKNLKEFPDELKKIVKDFITDVLITFPEYKDKFTENELEYLKKDADIEKLKVVFNYFKTVFPERFFDILYENEDMFLDNKKNTKFFKNIDFKDIWKEKISENTKNIIWKYLQLTLFSLSKNIEGTDTFGDTAKMFEAIDEDVLKNKLEEVISSMNDVFDMSNNKFEEMMNNMKENMQSNMDVSGENKNIPNPEDIQNHLNSLMGGKIGKLAQEIADETASELDIDTTNINGVGDIFSKLFKNPGQLMNMIKKVSSKLDQKLKSGEIKESELMQEANELVEKMKNTPGMKDMEKMLGKMGMGGKGGKVNMNMFQSMMKSNIKKSSQKERMLNKLKQRKQERELMEKIKQSQQKKSQQNMQNYDEYIQKTFNIDEKKIKKSKMKKKKKNKKKGKK